jgi:hypothetical protein
MILLSQAVQVVTVSEDVSASEYDRSARHSHESPACLRFARAAVETALETVGKKPLAENASVHLPRIGCGLAGAVGAK